MAVAISCWQSCSEKPVFSPGQLHLWRIPLIIPKQRPDNLKLLLNAAELQRAERLISVEKSWQFIVARSRLRQVLARYLDMSPAEIEFCYGAQGKPFIAPITGTQLYFNLSHSDKWMLLAVAQSGEVGVDIEQIDKQLDYRRLATQFLSAAEREQLNRFSADRRRRGFYRLWTLNEAWLKAIGGGFSTAHGQTPNRDVWQFRSLPMTKNYLAAICFSADITSILRYQLTP